MGWALATDGRNLSVYEQNGRRWADGYRPGDHLWLRVGVGSTDALGTRAEYAMPRSLLNRLARVIGVEIPAAPRAKSARGKFAFTRKQQAPITLRVRPGDAYYPPSSLFGGSGTTLTVTISSSAATSGRVIQFRWRDGAWVRA
jgi:hypothetical protein